MAVALRIRLGEAAAICVSLEGDVAYDLRDALYDDASWQSSSEACDLISLALDKPDGAEEHTITPTVAADLVRGIDGVAEIHDLPPALVALRGYLVRSS